MKKYIFLLLLLLSSICCFSQSRYIPESTKKVVYARDGGRCQCCGSTQNIEYDHIMPYSCGGSNDVSNIQLLCQQCNQSKSNSCYCKIHNNKVGINCCEGNPTVTPKSPSSGTSTGARQCSGTTKKGNRCRNKTTNSNGRCHVHQ